MGRLTLGGTRRLWVALMLAQACSRGSVPSDTQIDLLHLFPYTDSGQETEEINLGAPGSDAYLVRGWSDPETLPTGERIVRAIDREALVRFGVNAPTERSIHLHCAFLTRQLQRSPSPPIMVSLNGRPVSQLRLNTRFEDFTIHVSAEALHTGENILAFLQRTLPRRLRSRAGHLGASMACDLIRLESADGHPTVHPRLIITSGTPAALALPAESHTSFFLRLPQAAALAFELANDGDRVPQLSVSVQSDNQPLKTVWTAADTQQPARIDLGGAAGKIVRLDFEVEGSGTLRIGHPRIVGGADTSPTAHREPAARQPSSEPPNVLLYLIDTLRADHLGAYGYPLPTSPNIDALAAHATFSELTITSGKAPAFANGGGMESTGTVTLSNVTFLRNRAGSGGGFGGGLDNAGGATLAHVTFRQNRAGDADGDYAGSAGGMWNSGLLRPWTMFCSAAIAREMAPPQAGIFPGANAAAC